MTHQKWAARSGPAPQVIAQPGRSHVLGETPGPRRDEKRLLSAFSVSCSTKHRGDGTENQRKKKLHKYQGSC